MNPIKSPCIKICELDYQTGYCIGCFRTIDEISHWTIYNDREKSAILSELETRKNRLIAHG